MCFIIFFILSFLCCCCLFFRIIMYFPLKLIGKRQFIALDERGPVSTSGLFRFGLYFFLFLSFFLNMITCLVHLFSCCLFVFISFLEYIPHVNEPFYSLLLCSWIAKNMLDVTYMSHKLHYYITISSNFMFLSLNYSKKIQLLLAIVSSNAFFSFLSFCSSYFSFCCAVAFFQNFSSNIILVIFLLFLVFLEMNSRALVEK